MGVEAGRRALAAPGRPRPGQPLLLHPGPRLPRQDQRHHRPRRPRAWPRTPVPTTCAARCARAGPPSSWPPWPGRRPRPWPWSPTCAPACPGARTRARAATGRWPSSSRPSGGVAELLGQAAATDEFLDRWRVPGETASRQWEDRFGEEALRPPGPFGLRRCPGPGRAGRRRRRPPDGGRAARPGRGVGQEVARGPGRTGGARPRRPGRQPRCRPGGLALADVLERATAGPGGGHGGGGRRGRRGHPRAPPTRWPGCRRPGGRRASRRWPNWSKAGRPTSPTPSSCRGGGCSAASRPADPIPSGPTPRPCAGSEGWKFGFDASRCQVCGFRHLPPTRVCLSCQSVDQMVPERMADLPGHGGHLHRRPAGLQPLAADGRGGHRLRRRGPLPGGDDRRRPRCR